jgi:hypothetical protein
MADKPIDRKSLTTSLEQRYNNAPAINSGGGDAKTADKATTHFISEGDLDFQKQPQASNVEYHWNNGGGLDPSYKGRDTVPTVKYAPSGRL